MFVLLLNMRPVLQWMIYFTTLHRRKLICLSLHVKMSIQLLTFTLLDRLSLIHSFIHSFNHSNQQKKKNPRENKNERKLVHTLSNHIKNNLEIYTYSDDRRPLRSLYKLLLSLSSYELCSFFRGSYLLGVLYPLWQIYSFCLLFQGIS